MTYGGVAVAVLVFWLLVFWLLVRQTHRPRLALVVVVVVVGVVRRRVPVVSLSLSVVARLDHAVGVYHVVAGHQLAPHYSQRSHCDSN